MTQEKNIDIESKPTPVPAQRFFCIRCKKSWNSFLIKRLPKQCPNCKSPLWNKPYQRKARKKGGKQE